MDYLGIIENGIGVLLSMTVGEKRYELVYWFDDNLNYRIVAEEQFYMDYKIASMYEFSKVKELVAFIDIFILPSRDEIFKEFKLKKEII